MEGSSFALETSKSSHNSNKKSNHTSPNSSKLENESSLILQFIINSIFSNMKHFIKIQKYSNIICCVTKFEFKYTPQTNEQFES